MRSWIGHAWLTRVPTTEEGEMSDQRQFPAGSRVDDLDLSGVRLHGTNLEGARLTETYLCGADITGDIEGLRINGVEIEPLVQAERDRRFPERVKLRATDVGGLRDAWSMVEALWAATTERAERLSPDLQSERVDGEWSFVETLRHLVFATDCWLFRAVLLSGDVYHPLGLPWSGVSEDWARQVGLDTSFTPDLAAVLPVRKAHQEAVRATLGGLTDVGLAEVRTAPDSPGHPDGDHTVLQCVHVLLNEEWEHHRYAVRDLTVLEGGQQALGVSSRIGDVQQGDVNPVASCHVWRSFRGHSRNA
jgi:DinB superfamily/Pentapeptide repeats (8 copies)